MERPRVDVYIFTVLVGDMGEVGVKGFGLYFGCLTWKTLTVNTGLSLPTHSVFHSICPLSRCMITLRTSAYSPRISASPPHTCNLPFSTVTASPHISALPPLFASLPDASIADKYRTPLRTALRWCLTGLTGKDRNGAVVYCMGTMRCLCEMCVRRCRG
jgi:hypothetical protein